MPAEPKARNPQEQKGIAMKASAKSVGSESPIHYTEGRSKYWDPQTKRWCQVDTTKARLYYADRRIGYWDDQALALAVWLALPKGVRVAFRGKNDTTPVYPWDCVDKP